jgi:hypothetical protein
MSGSPPGVQSSRRPFGDVPRAVEWRPNEQPSADIESHVTRTPRGDGRQTHGLNAATLTEVGCRARRGGLADLPGRAFRKGPDAVTRLAILFGRNATITMPRLQPIRRNIYLRMKDAR